MKYTFHIECEFQVTEDRLEHAREDLEKLSIEVGALTNKILPAVHRCMPQGSILYCEVRHELTSESPDRYRG